MIVISHSHSDSDDDMMPTPLCAGNGCVVKAAKYRKTVGSEIQIYLAMC